MNKKALSLILIALLTINNTNLIAQKYSGPLFRYLTITKSEKESEWGYSDMELAKWGYMDVNGKTIIEPQFSYANQFSDGYAVVQVLRREESDNGYSIYTKWGVINKQGEMVIKPKFRRIEKFSNGLAKAVLPKVSVFQKNYKELRKKTRGGYIDSTGNFIIPWESGDFSFDMANSFSEGLAKVLPAISFKKAKEIIEDKKLLETFENIFGSDENQEIYSSSNPSGFINKSGKLIIENKFKFAGDFHEGLAIVGVYDADMYGFINKKGEIVINAQYENASYFSEGVVAVLKNDKWGFIDKTNKMIIEPKFDYADNFSEGMAAVKIEENFGFINKKGDLVIKAKYDRVGRFSAGMAAVGIKEGYTYKWGFINKQAELVIPFKFTGYSAPVFKNGLALVEITINEASQDEWNKGKMVDVKKLGYINTDGEWIRKPVKGSWDVYIN